MLHTYANDINRLAAANTAAEGAAQPIPIWFDLVNPTPEEDRSVERILGIWIPTRDEMEDIELSARLYQEDGAEFMTITALTNLDSEEPVKTPITFILKGPSLVTVRYADPKPFSAFVTRAQKPSAFPCVTGELTMLGLLESIIDRMADVLERIGNEIDGISREVFRSKVANATKKTRDLQSVIEQIGQKGDLLTAARESLVSISRLVAYHAALESPNRRLSKETRQRIKLLQRDSSSLGDHAAFLSGKINFLLDATLGLINLEQNQIIKIFSVAAVVFLPPTLVASIYGMNFDVMPELKWQIGYPFAIGLMILSAVMPFLYFKRRGWL
ncbi:magnesium transporter CorA family protein [Sinorhizobium meliloti]